MSLQLKIDDRRHGCYTIGWFDTEEGEFGLMIGQLADVKDDPETAQLERVAALTADGQLGGSSSGAFYWNTKSAARNALTTMRTALKERPEQPWPEWARTAAANGWKPPKEWKP